MKLKGSFFIKCLFFTLITVFYSCNKENAFDCVKSSGKIEERVIESDEFHSISVHDDIDLVLGQGKEKQIKLKTGRNLAPKIKFEVKDEVLYITNENTCNWVRKFENPKVVITLEDIKTLFHNGYGNITSEGKLFLKALDIQNNNGNGDINLDVELETLNIFSRTYAVISISGKVTNLHLYYIYNHGRFQGQNLIAENIDVAHYGLNTLHVFPIQYLNSHIAHSGNIIYYNEPEIMQSKLTSTGQLIKSY